MVLWRRTTQFLPVGGIVDRAKVDKCVGTPVGVSTTTEVESAVKMVNSESGALESLGETAATAPLELVDLVL